MGYMERYEEWLKRLPEDHPFHAELIAIKDNDAEIKDRFYRRSRTASTRRSSSEQQVFAGSSEPERTA